MERRVKAIKTDNLTQLNNEMVDTLVKKGIIAEPEIERAFRRVKRHHFLEGIVPPVEAYEDRAIMIKDNVSSSSQPHVMAMMLEEIDLRRGLKVLEVGTASGYNAALLAELVGRDSLVYTIEMEADLAERAAKILKEVGYPGITVIAGDGRKGYSIKAPYDRIIVTAQTSMIYSELMKQLAYNGIILFPFNFHDILTITIKLFNQGGGKYRGPLVGFPVNFVPIRGAEGEGNENRQIINYYNKLVNYLFRHRVELPQDQLVGLVLLLFTHYKSGKMSMAKAYHDLLEIWQEANKPTLNDYEFEYDNTLKQWQLIPIF